MRLLHTKSSQLIAVYLIKLNKPALQYHKQPTFFSQNQLSQGRLVALREAAVQHIRQTADVQRSRSTLQLVDFTFSAILCPLMLFVLFSAVRLAIN